MITCFTEQEVKDQLLKTLFPDFQVGALGFRRSSRCSFICTMSQGSIYSPAVCLWAVVVEGISVICYTFIGSLFPFFICVSAYEGKRSWLFKMFYKQTFVAETHQKPSMHLDSISERSIKRKHFVAWWAANGPLLWQYFIVASSDADQSIWASPEKAASKPKCVNTLVCGSDLQVGKFLPSLHPLRQQRPAACVAVNG